MALFILGSVGFLSLLIVLVMFVAAVRHGDETLTTAFSRFALHTSAATVTISALITWLGRVWPEAVSLSPAGILASTIPAAMPIGLWLASRTTPYQPGSGAPPID